MESTILYQHTFPLPFLALDPALISSVPTFRFFKTIFGTGLVLVNLGLLVAVELRGPLGPRFFCSLPSLVSDGFDLGSLGEGLGGGGFSCGIKTLFVPMGIFTFPLLRPFKLSLSRKWLKSESSGMSIESESESWAAKE